MKAKIFVIAVALFILAPVSYVTYLTYLRPHTSKPRAIPKPIVPPQQFVYSVNTPKEGGTGYLLCAPFQVNNWRNGQIRIIDMQGRTVFERHFRGMVYDFRQWVLQGNTYYTYIINDSNAYHIPGIALTAGHAVLLDSNLNFIKNIYLHPSHGLNAPKNLGLDLHDIILLSPDHYFTMAVYPHKVSNIPDAIPHHKSVTVASTVIQEVNQGKLVWQWDASKFAEFYAASNRHNVFTDTTTVQDYMHIDAMTLDPTDSNLICSFRDLNQVIKINRSTGEIVWRFGGKNSDFNLQSLDTFLGQHHITVTGKNSFMLLNNGDSLLRNRSSIVTFNIEERTKKITSYKAYPLPSAFIKQMGSVTKVGDNFLVGGGTAKYIVEIDKKTGKATFELTANQPTYRVYYVNRISERILSMGK